MAASAAALGAATSTAAQAATQHTSAAAGACAAVRAHSSVRVGRIAGIVHPMPVKGAAACPIRASDPANGTPPLIFHGGNVMTTRSAGPLVVTPIFWNPPGHAIGLAYKKILKAYLGGVAAASGQHTNVFSTLGEYFGTNGKMRYRLQLGTPVNDTDPLPPSGCHVNRADRTAIYADNSGYNACLDDNQVVTEINSVIGADHLPVDLGHIYVMYTPKHVESCFFPGSTTTNANACTINHQPSAAYCAYHSMAASGTVYANMPFPIYASPVGFTCGSDARFPTVQTPNGNADADTEVSPTSHEIMEAATDPDTQTGWYDSSGFENGDECAYVFGVTHGAVGARYNQLIGGHRYLTQEEFSNRDFNVTGDGCLQSE